jgi:microcystin-dependent protein
MSSPYIGEIRIFAGNFAPSGWAFCQGQLMPITDNDTLFSLIGVTYGGDGKATFALPDLSGRVPIHASPANAIGSQLGVETVTLNPQQIPQHNHAMLASNAAGTTGNPANATVADVSPATFYTTDPPSGAMALQTLSADGGSMAHENMMPFVALNFIISLFGIFPSQT